MPISDQTMSGSQEDLVHRSIRKTRQASNSSSLSLASESSLDDKSECFANDTAVQFQMTPAEQDPAVGFFCKLVSIMLLFSRIRTPEGKTHPCILIASIDKPRTLTILGIMLLGLVYVAMTPDIDDTSANVKL